MVTALLGNRSLGSTCPMDGATLYPSLRGPGTLQLTVEMDCLGPLLPGTGCLPWRGLARLQPDPVCWVRWPWTLWMFRGSQDVRGRDLRDGLRNRKRQGRGEGSGEATDRDRNICRREEKGGGRTEGQRGKPPERSVLSSPGSQPGKLTPASFKLLEFRVSPSSLCFPPRIHDRERVPIPVCVALCLDCVTRTPPPLSIKYP